MGKARGHRSREFVVYSDVMEPLSLDGWTIEQAFNVVLEKCGYRPEWGNFETATLEFRHLDGPDKGHLICAHSLVDHPWQFTGRRVLGYNGDLITREGLMRQVLAAGLNGWFGVTREQYDAEHAMAEQRMREPRLFAKGIE